MTITTKQKIIFVANTSWYIHNFRLGLIRELQSRGIDVVALAPLDQTSAHFAAEGVRYVELPMSRKGLNPLTDLAMINYLGKVYRAEHPDFVFHNTIKPVIYGSIAASFAGVKHILNMIPGLGYIFVGNRPVHKFLRPFVKLMYRFALHSSDCVFFQNPDDRDYFVQNGLIPSSRTLVTFGSGVDLDEFGISDQAGNNGVCTFILIGRLLWDKGVGEFVEAARAVRKIFPDTRFQLLGKLDEGNPSMISSAVLENWTADGSIEYLGETSDVRRFLAAADVAVLPSYREGVPKALLEAMAMGKPIITTDAPGCRETVVDGVNGLMVPVRDASRLADAMKLMVTSPQTRIAMGMEGRRLVSEKFDVRKVNARIMSRMGVE